MGETPTPYDDYCSDFEPDAIMGETPTPRLDDATVEAIAQVMENWVRGCAGTEDVIAKVAAALPDPRPTEAEVREVLDEIDWTHQDIAVLRDLGCFHPEEP
jgi:hypothetical protein